MLTITDEKNVLPFVAALKNKVHVGMVQCTKDELLSQRELYDSLSKLEMMIKNDIKNDAHPLLKQLNGDV